MRRFLFRNVFHDYVDADNLTRSVSQRVIAGQKVSRSLVMRRGSAVDFNIQRTLPGRDDTLKDRIEDGKEFRDELTYRLAYVVLHRSSIHLSEPLVDAEIAHIATQTTKAYGRSVIDRCELRKLLVNSLLILPAFFDLFYEFAAPSTSTLD